MQEYLFNYKNIEYVEAALGPERALNKDLTIVPVVNFLLAKGFEMADFGYSRITEIFKNKIYITLNQLKIRYFKIFKVIL